MKIETIEKMEKEKTENKNNLSQERLTLTQESKLQTETDDKLQTEEDLSKYDGILKGYPKTKTYVKQVSLIYPTSKKTIEKMVNARNTIEHHFKDTYEQNIAYGINQCFRFNKSRPSPAQVIAMITGDTVAELKQKEMDKNRDGVDELEKQRETLKKYKILREEALKEYRINKSNIHIRQRFQIESDSHNNSHIYPSPIKILDEIMADLISNQAHILSFKIAGIGGHGIGLSSHLSKISIRKDGRLEIPWEDSFTAYIRTKPYHDNVIRIGTVRTEIPNAFVEYIENLITKHKR